METDGRRERYTTLVADRKVCHACYPELGNPADWPQFDSDEVGPWSLWQGNLDAEVMVVGQDWGDTGFFVRHGGNEVGVYNPTNTALRSLLASVGIEIDPPSHGGGRGKAFFTNAVLCLKDAKGGLQGPVEKRWFRNCAPFLRRTIEIVQPKVVVSLGRHAYGAICRAYGLPPRSRLLDAVEDTQAIVLPNGSKVVPVYHCGALGRRNRAFETQLQDWQRVKASLVDRRRA